jgi:hypothetical protein
MNLGEDDRKDAILATLAAWGRSAPGLRGPVLRKYSVRPPAEVHIHDEDYRELLLRSLERQAAVGDRSLAGLQACRSARQESPDREHYAAELH